jgi:hypothetical protein
MNCMKCTKGMKHRIIVVALAAVVPMPAHAGAPGCKAQAAELRLSGAEREAFMARCERSTRSAPAPRSRGLTPADEDELNRAMSRNTLRSIDDQLRLRRN